MIGSSQEPVVEESKETIDAKVEALAAGTISVVMLPLGSTYMPDVPVGTRSIFVRDYAGAGMYIFDPKQINIAMLLALVKAGRHHELLGHVQSKTELAMQIEAGSVVAVRAMRSDGVELQSSVVDSRNGNAVEAQKRSLQKRFPGAEVRVEGAVQVLQERVAAREPASILHAFRDDQYRIGDLQAIGYLRTRTDLFPEGYLGALYAKMKTGISGKPGNSWLESLFCGMSDLSYDVIVPYLASRPLCIMGIWKDGVFDAAGFIFPTVNIGMGDQKAAFAGYGFFRYCHGEQIWGSEEAKTLAMLGISFFFVELGLQALHGIRYISNAGTKNFLSPFGFRDTGCIPRYMLRSGKLVDGVASSLLRENFEAYVEQKLVEEYENARSEPGDDDLEEPPAQRAMFE